MIDILDEQISDQDLSSPPLTATYIRGLPGGPCYLAISVHGIVGDNASRDILLTDIFTAFGQRLAGERHCAATGHHTMARVVAALCRARHASGGRGKPRLLAGDRGESDPARGQSGGLGTARGRRPGEIVSRR